MEDSAKRGATPYSLTKKLFIVVGTLLCFGLVMIYDSTYIYSQEIYGSSNTFAILHLAWVFVGIIAFLFFYRFNFKKLNLLAYPIFVTSLIFLVILAIVGVLPCGNGFIFSPCVNGANRWFFLNPSPLPSLPFIGVLGFQPGELAKFALILYLSFQLSNSAKREKGFLVYIISTLLFSFLILLQPNMSTALMIFAIGSVLYLTSELSLKPVFYTIPVLFVAALLLVLISPYRRDRLFTYLGAKPNQTQAATDLTEGYHVKQISIALGSGGFFGVGFGQSRQKYKYLPEVASDSIFAIIGEELGYFGTTAFLALYAYFLYLGFSIAKACNDLTGRLLATGVTCWMGIQFLINVMAMTRLIPLTGVPMPLVSYGGSSMIISLMAVGVLANVSRHSNV